MPLPPGGPFAAAGRERYRDYAGEPLNIIGNSVLCVAAVGAAVLAQTPDASALRDKLDAYLLDYQPKLSAVIATETNRQDVEWVDNSRAGRIEVTPGPRRTIESEIAFGSLPGGAGWLGFRRVRLVDRRPVANNGPTTDELLRNVELQEAARQLLEQGARHNLGAFRNTNLPNLPLELLHPRHRHRFSHTITGTARLNGTPVTVLVAIEHQSPSIIRGTNGTEVNSTVTAWIDGTGRLIQAEVRSYMPVANRPAAELSLIVKFQRHQALDLLVPIEMREVFWSDTHQRKGTAVAKYRDFRRFETAARILPSGRH